MTTSCKYGQGCRREFDHITNFLQYYFHTLVPHCFIEELGVLCTMDGAIPVRIRGAVTKSASPVALHGLSVVGLTMEFHGPTGFILITLMSYCIFCRFSGINRALKCSTVIFAGECKWLCWQ